VKCAVCGADCSQLRYESQRHIQTGEIENERFGYSLCAHCFADGKYPEDCTTFPIYHFSFLCYSKTELCFEDD
jgi:hypothetical protein